MPPLFYVCKNGQVDRYFAVKSNCQILVNYHKTDDISNSTKYEDKFIDPQHFQWMFKPKEKYLALMFR